MLANQFQVLFCSQSRKRPRFRSGDDMQDGNMSGGEEDRVEWLLNVDVDGNMLKVHIDPDSTFAALAALLEDEGATHVTCDVNKAHHVRHSEHTKCPKTKNPVMLLCRGGKRN